MTDQLREIGNRLAALRDIEGIAKEALASQCDVTAAQLEEYERGERDFSFSFLYNAAQALGVDVVDLMSGESPKLSGCCLTRAGQGYDIQRQAAYNYKHLAFTFRNKLAEPFMVTVEPKDDTVAPEQHSHTGQEFNLLIEGRLRIYFGSLTYDLNPGDSIFFDASVDHAARPLDGKPARFLAIVMQDKGD
ncbi:MAG: cupin domain-containing protein [Oscillospiraceae bacterium]|nr:cupin domain-containing protein [Oscillospiraceae bacterium]